MKYAPEVGRAAIAFFLASSLWLIVSAEESIASWVPVQVSLTLDTAITLVESPPVVRAFVVGRRRDLFKLVASPLTLQRAVTQNDRDSVSIELREQELTVPPGSGIAVRDLDPRLLTFRLRRKDGAPVHRPPQ
ncbi:MAG: hypothetical protein H7Z40_16455 [Phycisphaerae bacterium]|nr:hypothetical protein [Gemmatimonadaceae bacterium]